MVLSFIYWFGNLKEKGHTIYSRLREVFPSLQQFHSNTEFNNNMMRIIARCYPFIPKETADLIRRIAKNFNPHYQGAVISQTEKLSLGVGGEKSKQKESIVSGELFLLRFKPGDLGRIIIQLPIIKSHSSSN